MNEADSAFGRLRQHLFWKAREKIAEREERVDHDAFGRARMSVLSLTMNCRCARAPGLVANLAQLFAVNCVSELRAESLHVELINAAADLFVGRKGDGERAFLD